MLPVALILPLQIQPQPDETTCGPTCLHAIYRYWGENEELGDIIARTQKLEQGSCSALSIFDGKNGRSFCIGTVTAFG